MDEMDNFAAATGIQVIRDANCPEGVAYFVSKQMLKQIGREAAETSKETLNV